MLLRITMLIITMSMLLLPADAAMMLMLSP